MDNFNDNPAILIVEDDIDQMNLLVDYALNEIQKLIDDENTKDEQKQALRGIKILKITNIDTLEKAVTIHKNVLLAVLDCNIPDTKSGIPHDQLIKTNYRITGQHKSVDIITKYLPSTPITMISSLNRFRKLVVQHYSVTHSLNINFISKNDQSMINRNMGYYIRQEIAAAKGLSYRVIDD